MFNKWYIVFAVMFIAKIDGQKSSRVINRYVGCSTTQFDGESILEAGVTRMSSIDRISHNKGFSGTVSIVGGSPEFSNTAYFAAITALRIGADSVQIFCYSTVGDYIKSFSPDIAVYPILDTAINNVFPYLTKSDVVVLGPGLEKDAHSLNTVIPRVINHCKLELKPLIIDLDEYFITQTIVNLMLKYPYPGIILTPNSVEFEKLYALIKVSSGSNDGKIQIDYGKFGNNIFILRKGCTDSGISSNPYSSWSLSVIGSSKRNSGQGHMMAGAVGIYYFWALHKLPAVNITDDPMFKASIASYAAAKLVRECNALAYVRLSRSLVTSDMIDRIPDAINDF